jgi:hypothetical protein
VCKRGHFFYSSTVADDADDADDDSGVKHQRDIVVLLRMQGMVAPLV